LVTDLNIVTVKGRDIPIKPLNETQMMLLVREARVIRSDRSETDRRWRGIAAVIDIVESSILDGEDQEWLMGLAGSGQITFAEILEMVSPFEAKAEAAAKPVKRTRAAISRK
jgi:hypothetical protein